MLENIYNMQTVSAERLVDKLVDECTENLEELRISENTHKYNSCTLWIVLLCFNTSYNKQWN